MTAGPQNTTASGSEAAAAIGVEKRPVELATSASGGSAAGTDFEKLPVEQVLTTLAVQPDRGLSGAEAQKRLAHYGPNALVEKEESRLGKLLGYFSGPISYMIEAAALVSALLRRWDDFVIITGLLVFNAALGFWQDSKAANALAELKKGLALKARALRDGSWQTVEASPWCPVTSLTSSWARWCPADLKLVAGEFAAIDQSALTGESVPASKKPGDPAYSGSVVKQGEMTGVVTATGGNTFFGRTARLVAGAGAVSHAQKAMFQIGNFLIVVAVVLAGHRRLRRLPQDRRRRFLGPGRCPRHPPVRAHPARGLHPGGHAGGVLHHPGPRRARPVQEKGDRLAPRGDRGDGGRRHPVLGQDRDADQELIDAGRSDPVRRQGRRGVSAGCGACHKARERDAIDTAVMGALKDKATLERTRRPISSRSTRRSSGRRHHRRRAGRQLHGGQGDAAGGPRSGQARRRRAAQAQADRGAAGRQGYRALGVARSQKGDDGWRFLGVLPMFDPPRDDSKATIDAGRAKGVSVKMITGDDTAIAIETARQLGLGTNILTAAEFFPKDLDPDHVPAAIAEGIEKADGFARVFPEHKYAMVKALQGRGHLVAMTGDGVNDAPALKQADCGTAVSGATDAARGAAALILTAPGLSVINNAIDEARRIFGRINSYTIYRVALTLNIMFLVTLSTIFFQFTAAHRGHDRHPRPARRPADHGHRLRQHAGGGAADPLADAGLLGISSVLGFATIVQTMGLLLIGLETLSDPSAQALFQLSTGTSCRR